MNVGDAKRLLNNGAFHEAASILDTLLKSHSNNDELWYLRGICSLRLKNYEYAHECFERAVWISKKADYFKMQGLAHLECFELEEAIEDLNHALKVQPTASTYVFLAVVYLLMDNPIASDYLKKAYAQDKKITKTLLAHFYDVFFKKNPLIHLKTKEQIETKLGSL